MWRLHTFIVVDVKSIKMVRQRVKKFSEERQTYICNLPSSGQPSDIVNAIAITALEEYLKGGWVNAAMYQETLCKLWQAIRNKKEEACSANILCFFIIMQGHILQKLT